MELKEQIEQILKENQRLANIPEIANAIIAMVQPQENKEEQIWEIYQTISDYRHIWKKSGEHYVQDIYIVYTVKKVYQEIIQYTVSV